MRDQLDSGATSETAQTCKTIHTRNTVIPTRRIGTNDYGGQMIFGDLVGLKFPGICLTGEWKHQKKTSPKKPVPSGDQTRARCVTGAHATACSTALNQNGQILRNDNFKYLGEEKQNIYGKKSNLELPR